MVYSEERHEFLVGATWSGMGMEQGDSSFITIGHTEDYTLEIRVRPGVQSSFYSGQLLNPILVGDNIACITPANQVCVFNTRSYNWTIKVPFPGPVSSMAVLLNRNLVVQAEDSVQIFSVDILTSHEAHHGKQSSHIYPLGNNHMVCILQPTRCLTLLELETLQELHPDNTSLLKLFMKNQHQSPFPHALFSCGLVAEFDILVVMQAWQSGAPLPEGTEAANEDILLTGLSPKHTWLIGVCNSLQLYIQDIKHGIVIMNQPLDDLEAGKVYDITFDSEIRFNLKIDGPGQHIQITYDITALPSGVQSHTITKRELVPLPEPRALPPYMLDPNCEWVLDVESRRICWIPPGNLQRGAGGHFWVGLSLVMVGDDGVVRKLTFKEPDC